MKAKRRYAVITAGGNVYQDRMGRFSFGYWRCLAKTMWPRGACYGGTVHHLPLRGLIPGYIPPFPPEGSWE